jgi:adenosylhomocysteine nucleosidase
VRAGKKPIRRAFVIAMACEADAVRPFLGADDRLYVSGIGKVNAAAATQQAIGDGAREIWNVGVAGGFDAAHDVGDCLVIDRAVEYDFDLSEVNGTRVGVHDERTTPYFACADDFAPHLPRATLATGDRFGDSDADLATLADLGATVRDMEGAAVAHVCERNGVPCRVLKSLSDVHGKGSMVGQYQLNRDRALASLSASLREIFRA